MSPRQQVSAPAPEVGAPWRGEGRVPFVFLGSKVLQTSISTIKMAVFGARARTGAELYEIRKNARLRDTAILTKIGNFTRTGGFRRRAHITGGRGDRASMTKKSRRGKLQNNLPQGSTK